MELTDFLNWQTNNNHRIAIYCREPVVSAVRLADPNSIYCIIEDYPDCERFTHRILWKDYYEQIAKSHREDEAFLARAAVVKPKIKKRLSVKDYMRGIEEGDIDFEF